MEALGAVHALERPLESELLVSSYGSDQSRTFTSWWVQDEGQGAVRIL
jgi:hypothetical protein